MNMCVYVCVSMYTCVSQGHGVRGSVVRSQRTRKRGLPPRNDSPFVNSPSSIKVSFKSKDKGPGSPLHRCLEKEPPR